MKIEPLPSGKSFNNRIYFLSFQDRDNALPDAQGISQSTSQNGNDENTFKEERLVLKVSGQFFGPAKVENEVSGLYLMEKYCPGLPAPRVVAWSLDGHAVQSFERIDAEDAGQTKAIIIALNGRIQESQSPSLSSDQGWILITQLPGQVLNPAEDLPNTYGDDLMRQLAGMMHTWRTQIPNFGSFGNVHLFKDDIYQPEISTSGLLNSAYISETQEIKSTFLYFKYLIEDTLSKLSKQTIFSSPKRDEILTLVHDWISTGLADLSICAPQSHSNLHPYFTHYDLSPRNILVSHSNSADTFASRLQITGLIDFEFSGFFPMTEEFTNNSIANAGDWPEKSYEVFLAELARLGTATPKHGFETKQWKEACLISRLIGNIAPWQLEAGCIQGEELQKELMEAAGKVEEVVRGLRHS